MRLIYSIRNFELTNGNGRLVWELSRLARAQGHDVHVVAHRFPKKKGTGCFFSKKSSLSPFSPHYVAQLPKIFGQWRARSFAWLSSRCARRLKGAEALIHGFGDSYVQDILTLGNTDWSYGQRIPSRKVSGSAVGIKSRALRDPATLAVTVVSKQMKTDVLEHFSHLKEERVRVIYPGVDLERFNPGKRDALRQGLSLSYGINKEAFWIVFAAGGDFQKRNFEGVLKALSRVPEGNWVFLVVGAREFAMPPALSKRSFFFGRVDDLSQIFPACDLMVYPAWYDEFALVCLEAWASGVPVALSRSVGASEILPQEIQPSCVLNDPSDANDLAGKIEYWIKKPLQFRSETFSKIAGGYPWENFYKSYLELYEEALEKLNWTPN